MTITIHHFSDVLCVWAYVAQVRMEELMTEFGDSIDVRFHFCPVFGDAHGKIEKKWGAAEAGLRAYADHVRGTVERFDHVAVHPDVWVAGPARSSLSAHLFLRAVDLAEQAGRVPQGAFPRMTAAVRAAFFGEAQDVSTWQVQRALAIAHGLDSVVLEETLQSGAAAAALSQDFELVRSYDVTVSPTIIFNQGRQRLNGNVGFRILEANVRELLRTPEQEASWC